MKWGLKGGISIDADSGPLRHVLWCCGSICHQLLTFIQICYGHTVVYYVCKILFRLYLALLCFLIWTHWTSIYILRMLTNETFVLYKLFYFIFPALIHLVTYLSKIWVHTASKTKYIKKIGEKSWKWRTNQKMFQNSCPIWVWETI